MMDYNMKVACEFRHIGNRKLSSTNRHYDYNPGKEYRIEPPSVDDVVGSVLGT